MPIKHIDKDRFIQRWDREWDIILLVVAHLYRSPKGIIQWKKARADGYLESLPQYLTSKELSRRTHHLLYQKYNSAWIKKKKEMQRKATNRFDGNPHSFNRRRDIFMALPNDIKKKYGYKSKQIWSSEQQNLLIGMAEEYRVSEKKIDWKSLVQDKRIKHFPHGDLKRLRSYYWRVITLATNPGALETKRASSRRWKAEHIDRYRNNQKRRNSMIRKAANDYINAQQD